MKIRMAWVTLVIMLLTCGQAYAQNPSRYARPGFYIGAGGLYAIEDFDNTFGLDFKNSPGFNGRLGYRFHPNIAVEAMIERVDAFDLKGFNNNVEINTWTGTLNGKFFALTERFQPYGLLGIGAMRARANLPGSANDYHDTDIAFRIGVGLDSYITENWLVNLEIANVRLQETSMTSIIIPSAAASNFDSKFFTSEPDWHLTSATDLSISRRSFYPGTYLTVSRECCSPT